MNMKKTIAIENKREIERKKSCFEVQRVGQEKTETGIVDGGLQTVHFLVVL